MLEIAKTCMDQNYFQFRGKFYQQHSGLSMGCKLSPFLANIYMSDLEERLRGNNLFPVVWHRYVDDIFCVTNARLINPLKDLLNSQHTTIKFTVELEEENKIAFLDLWIKRSEDDGLRFSIYRKPTHTDRYITVDSHHHASHKKVAFHSMAFRLINIPMSESDFEQELEYILNAAKVNGFSKEFVDEIVRKHTRTRTTRQLTTLTPAPVRNKMMSLPYYPKVTNRLSNILKKYGIHVVTRNNNTLRHELCNYKDKPPPLSTSGIYEVSCKDCDTTYIGQTKRSKEHCHPATPYLEVRCC